MPLNKRNTRVFHRTLFSGQLEKIKLLKRDDDQRQGIVTEYILFQCRKGKYRKSGQTLDGEMNSSHAVTWHIPRSELDRLGIAYLNPLDRIVELEGQFKDRIWQPESTTGIDVKLFEVHVDVDCLLLRPAISRVGVPGY